MIVKFRYRNEANGIDHCAVAIDAIEWKKPQPVWYKRRPSVLRLGRLRFLASVDREWILSGVCQENEERLSFRLGRVESAGVLSDDGSKLLSTSDHYCPDCLDDIYTIADASTDYPVPLPGDVGFCAGCGNVGFFVGASTSSGVAFSVTELPQSIISYFHNGNYSEE